MVTIFWLLALVLVVSALGVLFMPNPLHSALCLVVNLVAVAGMYAVMEAHFLAATQIVVYAGAIMVLIIFVLMLLNSKEERRTLTDAVLVLAGLGAVGGLACLIIPVAQEAFQNSEIGLEPTPGTVRALGLGLFREHIFLIELCAVILLTAILAVVVLANPRRRAPR